MTIPAWQLISWKPVLTTLPEFRLALVRMRPVADPGPGRAPRRGEDLAPAAPRHGQAHWAATHRGDPLGLAWDWAEVREDVVALSDPMNVLSNVSLVNEQGEPIDDAERIVHLNSAVHELDWQAHVTRQAHGARSALAA